MSILTSANDPLENKRLFVGAKNVEGTPNNEMIFSTFVVDWYAIVPEAYYKEYLPDNLKNINLDDPVNNTYFLIYITDTYESIHGDRNAQRIMSLTRWNMIDSNNHYLRLSYVNGVNTSNLDRKPEALFMDDGDETYRNDRMGFIANNHEPYMWATERENGYAFGMASTEARDKYGDRPGDPMNSPAWCIGKYVGKLNSLMPKYNLRTEFEVNNDRIGRVPTCWKIYQSTNETNPKWQLLDSHYKDDILYGNGGSMATNQNYEFTCNFGQ